MSEKYTDPNGNEFRTKYDADLYERRLSAQKKGVVAEISYNISGLFRKILKLAPIRTDGSWMW
ncbi:MAG: hypothetical protein D3919_10810 [Candidatus Electrothrix sp. AW5]|nr:hypothetical protein [Candidatus Electrothrix gigas]MCI5227023.1 hypothetical protein [Candidatus Electrothrix gigas]